MQISNIYLHFIKYFNKKEGGKLVFKPKMIDVGAGDLNSGPFA